MKNEEETDQDFTNRLLTVTDQLDDGVDFADVAAALSDDLGSAALGGELGFTDGAYVSRGHGRRHCGTGVARRHFGTG